MTRSAKILRNVVSNWGGFVVSAAVTLILTPFVLHHLGEARYGIWVLTASIVGYYGLLDLGFRSGVTQYLTRYFSAHDYESFNECISSAVAALSALGGVIAVLSLGVAYLAPYIFELPDAIQHEAFWCILIVGFASAAQCTLSPFGAVFTATQRFDLANLIGVGTRLLMAGGIYAALQLEYGLIGVSVATCGANLIDYAIRWHVAHKLVPNIRVSLRGVKLARLREMMSFGAWNFLIALSSYIYLHGPTLIIGSFMPIAAVGHYALATGLTRQIGEVLKPVGQVMYPAAVEMHIRKERAELIALYRIGTRFMMLGTVCMVIVAAFWAEDFYRLWIGDKYLSGESFHSVALLLQILLISIAAAYGSNIAGQILIAVGHVRMLAILHICGAALSLIISLLLIRVYGLVGVAVAAAIVAIFVEWIGVLLGLRRVLDIPIYSFVSACVRPIVVGLLLALLLGGIRGWMEPVGDWFDLILHGVLAGLASLALTVLFGITSDERRRFVVNPLGRLIGSRAPQPTLVRD